MTIPAWAFTGASGLRFTSSNTGGQDLRITMGDYSKRRIVFNGSSPCSVHQAVYWRRSRV